MAEHISSLLRQSVGHLADEVPDSYRVVLDTIGPLVVGLDIDGERFSLRGGRRLTVTSGADESAGARVVATRGTVLDVLDAAVTLNRAVQTGALTVHGTLDDILRAHDTLRAYVHAAVRAPSQPGLLAALRSGAT
ncbi:MAG: SCP-2 sterol transfer family protein [Mycobacterium sp.]|jgi:hypothetical protein